jgi:hypothetical protein
VKNASSTGRWAVLLGGHLSRLALSGGQKESRCCG